MRLKTFTAASVAEALEQVRRQLGPDAIIVSTESRSNGKGARVIAALDTDAPIDGGAMPYGRVSRAQHGGGDDATTTGPDPLAIRDQLDFHAVPAALSDQLLRHLDDFANEDAVLALAAAIDCLIGFRPLSERLQTRPLMLVGPPGAGKTLATAKLMLRAHRSGRPYSVVTTDLKRAGAVEQLDAFCRILDCALLTAGTAKELAAVVAAAGDRLVLIDTAGCNPFCDADTALLAAQAAACGAEPILVLPAGGDAMDCADIAAAFAAVGCRRMIASRIDIARRFGGLLAAAVVAPLALAEISGSPDVAEALHPANPVALARLLVSVADPSLPHLASPSLQFHEASP